MKIKNDLPIKFYCPKNYQIWSIQTTSQSNSEGKNKIKIKIKQF